MSSRGKSQFAQAHRHQPVAGAGGCSLGFGQAGYDVRFATHLDADAVESYRRNFPGTPCEVADIRELTAEPEPLRVGLNPGNLDMLLGQGFSGAGVKAAYPSAGTRGEIGRASCRERV